MEGEVALAVLGLRRAAVVCRRFTEAVVGQQFIEDRHHIRP